MRRKNGRYQSKIGGSINWITYTLMTAYAAICDEGNLHKIAYRLPWIGLRYILMTAYAAICDESNLHKIAYRLALLFHLISQLHEQTS